MLNAFLRSRRVRLGGTLLVLAGFVGVFAAACAAEKIVETVVVERQVPVEVEKKVVETVVVEREVAGEKVVETVVVEKPVEIEKKVVETVVVEKEVKETVVVERVRVATPTPAPAELAPAPKNKVGIISIAIPAVRKGSGTNGTQSMNYRFGVTEAMFMTEVPNQVKPMLVESWEVT
ncbi:MAG: hypothetical protein FJ313_06220, partial [Gemmatimonadetes bacterium]|nr:hypothetical protein [Gemmatimonadota bacterium]